MRATSEASLSAADERFTPILDAAGEGARELGEQIFSVVDALDGSVSLRRALTDPTRSGDSKAQLATGLLRGKVHDDVVDLVAGLARSRWSADADLPEALEELGTTAVLVAAEARGDLLRVEEDLFRLGRILAGERDLRVALASTDATREQRVALSDRLLEGQIAPESQVLVRRTVGALRQRTVTTRLARIAELASARRQRVVASVLAATPLTSAQVERLTATLSRIYDTEVHVNVALDPSIVGGLRIQVGAEVVDATVLSKLAEARRRIAG
ncbi:F0F1 ATP synthase subunit delta [Litorihabitans aurantiacus]|uniref:ATP synthase subunit delta n=1 Tax=Litorihabitans aurantiacus TaxID=1930061 RepID=A0AA37USP7_9MICO|nr:F0F1 ATP synthase subunit delta [Litorihabitans aurantiacus]GMA30695.1 ATP synthase subunit delta [Litorihabitans aurantiacus]